jgi:radical SAM-linked protein
MGKLRLRYSKSGKAKYISHLDLAATMQRALLRSNVQLEYSGGFNPHPYMSVALPLSVACGSRCELMDVGVVLDNPPEGLRETVNASLPEGIKILEIYTPQRKFNEIAWIGIEGKLHYNERLLSSTVKELTERFAAESIRITKRTKSGYADIDIAPHIRDIEFTGNDIVLLCAKISAHDPTLKPDDLLSALNGDHIGLMPDFVEMTRIEIYDKHTGIFR